MDDEAAVLELLSLHGPLSTEEVADALDWTRRAADYRLRALYAGGKLESTTVGSSLLWWVSDDVDEDDSHRRAVSE